MKRCRSRWMHGLRDCLVLRVMELVGADAAVPHVGCGSAAFPCCLLVTNPGGSSIAATRRMATRVARFGQFDCVHAAHCFARSILSHAVPGDALCMLIRRVDTA